MTEESACLLRAIRGPVMLITIGTLFALDNFTPFGFGRTWPVLLVVVGILNLGQGPKRLRGRFAYRAQCGPIRQPNAPAPPPPPPPPQPSATSPSTAPPGSYRGSPYEATPGGSGPRGQEPKMNRENPFGGPGATP